MHISDVTVALGIGKDDTRPDRVVAFAENIRGDLKLFIDDRVDRKVAAFDLGSDVVDRDASKTAQWGASRRIDVARGGQKSLMTAGALGSITRCWRI